MRRAWLLLMVPIPMACEKPVVAWSEITYPKKSPPASAPARFRTGDSGACVATWRSWGSGPDSVAAWWSIRSDSSSLLKFARFAQGKWSEPVSIDTTDASRRGCSRPAPAIAADISEAYVHIAYFLEPASGPGVFFAHSMDAAGFHDPVSIAFGKRASEVSIASGGDRIAVAYEEPNAERGQIWVALSKSMGHIFESRVPVSSPNEIAKSPRVSLNGTKLDVEWLELLQADPLGRRRIATRTGSWN